jgi:hypothetical protein
VSTVDRLAPPAALTLEMRAPIIQTVLNAPIASVPSEPEHVVLGSADVSDMLDLAGRTRHGPFSPRTIEFGHYIRLRVERRQNAAFLAPEVCGPALRGMAFAQGNALPSYPKLRLRR